MRVTVLVPLSNVAMSVLLPAFKLEDNTSTDKPAEPKLDPFKDQVTAQLESLGTVPNVVEVEPADATLTVAVLGELEVTEQLF